MHAYSTNYCTHYLIFTKIHQNLIIIINNVIAHVTDLYVVFHLKLHITINQYSVLITIYMVYLAISLANWYIGGNFSFANRVILSVHCFMTFHYTCNYKYF